MNEVEELKAKIHELELENEKLRNRGAGRKSRVTEQQKTMMLMLRARGMSYEHIAAEVGTSSATVYRYIRIFTKSDDSAKD